MGNIHNAIDNRNITIDNVGIVKYKLPITFKSKKDYSAIAEIQSGVSLSSDIKGAHLSRIIEVLDEKVANRIITIDNFIEVLKELSYRLELNNANIEMNFSVVVPVVTPISKRITYLSSDVTLFGAIKGSSIKKSVSLTATGAMLCPNSKAISNTGAHSQKCNLKATLYGEINNLIIEDILKIIFGQFSAEVYGIVKSVDEKVLTEKAYQNPKFSEDLIRDTLIKLREYYIEGMIVVEIENLESIHQHNVYAKGILK